ncbi:hypothetical protein AB0J84_32045, partial [Micromonospora arborensis]|uniref:hypothetical protein n=1 Tax=Micromonospora arborensis TaxID=2116518 RepID=UPI003420A639
GGSVGLAVLSSVSLHFAGQRTERVIGPITTALPGDPEAVGRALLQACCLGRRVPLIRPRCVGGSAGVRTVEDWAGSVAGRGIG